MFNFTTICESVRRHWMVIAAVTFLGLCVGVASSFVENEAAPSAATSSYTAEASLYLSGYGYDEKEAGEEYNYSISEGYMVTDARRLVISTEVAGVIRSQYGEDVVVAAPVWKNEEKNSEYGSRFLFIDVTAADSETAKVACQEAVDLTTQAIWNTLPVAGVELVDPVTLKSGDHAKAADWGNDAFASEEKSVVEAVTSGISLKKVIIFAFSALVLSVLAFASYDIISRRIRSVGDVERLLDFPVISSIADDRDFGRLANGVKALANRSGLSRIAVAGASSFDNASHVYDEMIKNGGSKIVSDAVDLSDEIDAASRLIASDAVLLVISEGASKSSQLACALEQLRFAGVPVLGVVFLPKKSKSTVCSR